MNPPPIMYGHHVAPVGYPVYRFPGNVPAGHGMHQVISFGQQGGSQVASSSTSIAAAQGTPVPNVATPADRFGRSPLLFPIFPEDFGKLPVKMGYWEATHERYNLHKRYLQEQASAHKNHFDVTRIKFFLKTLLPGKEKPILVGVSEQWPSRSYRMQRLKRLARMCAKPSATFQPVSAMQICSIQG